MKTKRKPQNGEDEEMGREEREKEKDNTRPSPVPFFNFSAYHICFPIGFQWPESSARFQLELDDYLFVKTLFF